MWTREDNTWKRYKYSQTQRRFKENYFDQILLFQKCVNAVTYMPVDNLENIYNTFDYYSLDNWEEYHNTLKTYYTPGSAIDGLINIIQVDLASTEDIDITQEYINPIIDTEIVTEGHLVLLKDQTNTIDNGIYKFELRKFVKISTLENYADRLNYSVYIKLGSDNLYKQFFLERDVTSLYPTDTDPKTFKEGHNYIVKHKFEYKNLNDVTLHDSAIKTDSFVVEGIDVGHNMAGGTEVFLQNIPAGTLPSVAGGEIYMSVFNHSDVIFGFLPVPTVIKIISEVVVPNGPNFDHTYTTDLVGFGAATTIDLVDIRFDYNVTLTVGEFGLLIKDYSDFSAGRDTKLIKTGDKNRLRGVHMSDDLFNNFTGTAYTCGNNGTILKSIDFGESFDKLPAVTDKNLHDVYFYNLTVGMAVGERGTVLITEDGGLNWVTLQSDDINEQKIFNAVFMNTLDQAIVIGDRGMFFVINKVGNSWTMSKLPIVRIEDALVSYSIINDMKDIIYDLDNDYYYITGSEGLIVRIDSNFDTVFFEDNSNINFKNILISNGDLTVSGEDDSFYTFTPTVSLAANSNISSMTALQTTPTYAYEDDHEYNRLLVSAIDSTMFGIGNHTFYNILTGGAWLDINLTLFDEIKTRLLALDYKLGRKLYFIDNDGDVVKPTNLYDFSIPGTPLPGIDVLIQIEGDELNFYPHGDDHNFWEYYIEHNLYDPVSATKPNVYTVKTVIAPYRYAADNITSGGATDFVIGDDFTTLKLTNTALILNQGDLIKVTIKETVPSFNNFLEEVFMVISWDGTNAVIKEVFNDTLKNDLYNGPYPFTMEVTNLTFIEEGNQTDFVDNLNDGFFGFYDFAWDATNAVMTMNAADKALSAYFNMRIEMEDGTGIQYVLDYKEADLSFNYGPYYNILNVLSDVDPVFIPGKTFNMPQIVFPYESSGISPNQFVFDGNKIIMGLTHKINFEKYFENTFVDIVHNGIPILTRVQILKMEEVDDDGTTRFYMYFDNLVQDLVALHSIVSTNTLEVRSRNTLEEISYDLTRSDDVHHDMFKKLSTDNVNERRYKEGLATFNSDNYAKIFTEDADIKEHVTGLIYTDNNHDLAFNVLNVSDDPSFNFEPVDLYDVGVDEIPKRANAINPNNVETYTAVNTKTGRRLTNVDFNKYSFRLVDGLNIVTLSQKYGWILETEMIDAVIGEDENGLVWYTGEWLCGIWNDGTWYNGIFHDGIWLKGEWKSRSIEDLGSSIIVKQLSGIDFSSWLGGTWLDGTWFNGTHFDGDWQDGSWLDGLWLNGQWDTGTWSDGDWKGGLWITGTWNNGTFSMENATSIWFFGYWYGGDFKNGIWKDGFFNQGRNNLSRFGTESSFQLRSIWENGSFVNGEIHTFADTEDGDVTRPLISGGYEHTVFNAGEIRSGTCYGATFRQGNWYGGNMLQGYVDGALEVDVDNFVLNADTLTLDVSNVLLGNYKHYIKVGDRIQIVGEEILFGPMPLTATHEEIGYNTSPGSHLVTGVDFNTGNIDILLDNPAINHIDQTLGTGYENMQIIFTVHNGVWENSIWDGGLWLGGTWNGGMWVDGIWDNGKWMDESNPQP